MKKSKMIPKFAAVIMAALCLMLCSFAVSAAADAEPAGETAAVSEGADYTALSPSKKSSKNPVKIVVISLAISVLATGITVFLIYNSYKNNGKTEPYPYNQKAPLDLKLVEDIHVDTQIRRTRIERNNN